MRRGRRNDVLHFVLGRILSLTQRCGGLLPSAELENHCDLRFDLHRLPLQHVRPVFPLLDCIQCRLSQQRMSADHLQVLNGTFPANQSAQNHLALHSTRPRDVRIDRIHLADDEALSHTLRNPHSLWARAFYPRRRLLGGTGAHILTRWRRQYNFTGTGRFLIHRLSAAQTRGRFPIRGCANRAAFVGTKCSLT